VAKMLKNMSKFSRGSCFSNFEASKDTLSTRKTNLTGNYNVKIYLLNKGNLCTFFNFESLIFFRSLLHCSAICVRKKNDCDSYRFDAHTRECDIFKKTEEEISTGVKFTQFTHWNYLGLLCFIQNINTFWGRFVAGY
jgi:hypothetical protein